MDAAVHYNKIDSLGAGVSLGLRKGHMHEEAHITMVKNAGFIFWIAIDCRFLSHGIATLSAGCNRYI